MKNSTRSKKSGSRGKVTKSAITGKFVSAAYAKKHKATTFTETIKKGKTK